ncbi:hypothetical protein KC19_3G228200 [Ceratodon purpureus]|uniref:Uncharacterized protein n=1 Tax=Ceratodon purpureus TaxID=3225 RepID=A0A8T0INW8_CERPU|nr:hypothetical protein KC19_3G228200 [Ceratodon purpureus]
MRERTKRGVWCGGCGHGEAGVAAAVPAPSLWIVAGAAAAHCCRARRPVHCTASTRSRARSSCRVLSGEWFESRRRRRSCKRQDVDELGSDSHRFRFTSIGVDAESSAVLMCVSGSIPCVALDAPVTRPRSFSRGFVLGSVKGCGVGRG